MDTNKEYKIANERFDSRAIELLREGWKRIEVRLPDREPTTYFTKGYRGTTISAVALMWMPHNVFVDWYFKAASIYQGALSPHLKKLDDHNAEYLTC